MKVLYVFPQFPSYLEPFAAVEVRALKNCGVDIRAYSMRGPDPDTEKLSRERGTDNVPLDHNSIGASLRGLVQCFRHPLQVAWLKLLIFKHCWKHPKQVLTSLLVIPRVMDLMAMIKKMDTEVVHLYWGHYPSLLGLLIQRFEPGIVVSLSTGSYDMLMEYGPASIMIQDAHCVSSFAAANIPQISAEGRAPEKIDIFHHGVDIPDGYAPPDSSKRNPFGLACINRLVPEKVTDEAIRVVSILRERWPETTLQVLGDGSHKPELEALAKELGLEDAVTFHGWAPHDEVLNTVRTSTVLLSMSQYEGERLPNIVKEGMLGGSVCIASQTPGIEVLVQNGETGYVLETNGAEETARIIEEHIFSSPENVEAIRKAAFLHIDESFNAEREARARVVRWKQAQAALDS